VILLLLVLLKIYFDYFIKVLSYRQHRDTKIKLRTEQEVKRPLIVDCLSFKSL